MLQELLPRVPETEDSGSTTASGARRASTATSATYREAGGSSPGVLGFHATTLLSTSKVCFKPSTENHDEFTSWLPLIPAMLLAYLKVFGIAAIKL